MGISSALFTGVSGLNTLGNAMAVIGDNIANVNTIGFKSSRSTFETVLAQSVAGASGTSQVGRGVALSAIDANFSQGSFESTSEPTDMAIGGKGFFMVRSEQTGLYYTRAGHFIFDAEGYLVNPAELRVQGWLIDPTSGETRGAGEITDILIDATSASPNPTSEIDIAANLDSSAEILDTGASVASGQDSTSGFVFTPGTNDVLDLGGTDVSLISQGGLEQGRVYSGAEVADAIEQAMNSALPATYSVAYNSPADPNNTNTFEITTDDIVGVTINNPVTATANNTLGITGPINISAGTPGYTNESREFYVETGVNDNFEISVDSNPRTGEPVLVRIDQGAYSGDALAVEMERQINDALSVEGVSVDVRYDESNPSEKVFRITSSSRGTGSEIDLDPGTDNFLTTVRISEYDSVTEGSGDTAGGFTQSANPIQNRFLLWSGTTGANNEIIVDGTPVNLNGPTFPSGYYTGEEIADRIQAEINNLPGHSVVVTYADGFFNILNNGGLINIDWANSSAAEMLGYDQVAEDVGTNLTAVSDFPVAFNIVADQNDSLQITVDNSTGGPVSVIIDEGVYTGEALANELETAINDQLLSDGDPGTVAVSYDIEDGFIIESSTLGGDGSIQINAIAGSDNLVEETLGINDFTVNLGAGFQVEDPDITSNYSTSLSVYDSLGDPHTVSIYFRKATESDSASTWEWFAYVPAGDTQSGEAEVQAQGELTFNNFGILTNQTEPEWLTQSGTGFDFGGSSANGQLVDIDFGLDSDTNVTTQFSSPSATIFQTQDGYGSGYLQDVSVNPFGVITGNYSNGQVLYLAQIALADFTSPWGLSREGGNNYAETPASGEAMIDAPGTGGNGTISPNSLEQSNVDLSTEFVNMIIQQRGFQANSKVITTTDSMLAELINLKR